MTGQRRVTQSDVAAKAGVHRATVSLVLKNHPSIPEATRQKVLAVAKEMGYERDPMLSVLAAYRNGLAHHAMHGELAWLAFHDWGRAPIYGEYFAGARNRAKECGYILEKFEAFAKGMTVQRLASILRARNITGILLCPLPHPTTELAFPWETFSVVTFGYSLLKPRFHTVTATQYGGIVTTMQHLYGMGYRRIGYCAWPTFDERTNHNYLSGYLVQAYLRGCEALPPCYDYETPARLKEWIRTHRVDAIVTSDSTFMSKLEDIGFLAPRDVGLACFSLPDGEGTLCGVRQNSLHIGAVAVDTLVGMIHRRERGIPAIASRTLIEGEWHAGATAVRQGAAPAPKPPGKRRR